MSAMACACLLPSTLNPTSTPMAPAPRSAIMLIAVKMSVAPRSSLRRPHTKRLILATCDMACTYELGVDSWRMLVDEIVDGVITPNPGITGNRGDEL